jgi:hypothetical protein
MAQTNSKQQWLDWIDEQEQSDLSVAAFCRHKKINADNFYYHRGQHRKKSLPVDARFIRAQFVTEPAVTSYSPIKVVLGDLTIYLPLDKPLQAADVIKALQ